MAKEFIGGVEEESRMVLRTDSTTRCRVMGVGMAWPGSHHHVFEVFKMWGRRVSCRRQSGTGSSPLLEKGKDELVWIQRKESGRRRAHREEKHSKGREGSAAQRGKGAAKRHTVRRTGRRSKRGR